MRASGPSASACRPTQTGTDIPEFGVEFDFGDKFAPRVGFAYDIKGDGRSKVFGSWGMFYDIFKLELPRGSFGGDRWLEDHYTLDTFDWTSLAAARTVRRHARDAHRPGPRVSERTRSTSGTCRSTPITSIPT